MRRTQGSKDAGGGNMVHVALTETAVRNTLCISQDWSLKAENKEKQPSDTHTSFLHSQ